MRKIASLLAMLVFFSAQVFAQQRTVTGVVRDDKGNPIPFATVLVTGTNNATQADATGAFNIKLESNQSLTISATGFTEQVLTPGPGSQNIILVTKENELQEVVITTAFGIKRSARVTPYSAQVIDAERLKLIPQINVNNALAGKVAGAQFRGQSPIKLSSQGSFRIRGGQGTADQEPIYVVDGTIVNSIDINPDDVADVTVLKGANATALFGGRAVNGAIVINTKRGGQAGTSGIEVNQGIVFDKVYILPEYQNLYAGGSSPDLTRFNYQAGMDPGLQALDGAYYHDMTDDASWGPRMSGQQFAPWYAFIGGHSRSYQTTPLVPHKDNARDFWSTGVTNTTNVSFSKSGQGYNTRLSYTNNSVQGMLPNTGSQRNSLTANLSLDLSSHFTAGVNVNYSGQTIDGTFDDGYANQSAGGMSQWFHRDLDMKVMKDLRYLRTPINTLASWNFTSNPNSGNDGIYKGNYWYNFYSYFDNLDYQQKRDRVYGDVFLTYKINQDFRIRATVRKNSLNTYFENILPSIIEQSGGQTGLLGSYSTRQTRASEMNYELLASFNKTVLDKLAISANVGANLLRIDYKEISMATVNGLNVPGLYAISNSKANPALVNTRELEKQRAAFASGDFEWNKFASLSWAVRADYYSTLFGDDNRLVSSAVGAGFVFSEFLKETPWLSFGKVFASYGTKPLPLGVYVNNFLYSVQQNQWDGNFLMTTPDKLVDPSVTGSLIKTFEAGFDIRFLKGKIGLNATYYKEKNEKAPITVSTSAVAGYSSKVLNAANFEREGLEFILDARPVVSKDFSWEITKTFSYLLNNPVVDLAEGLDEIVLAAGSYGTRYARAFLEKGSRWGQLIGGGISRDEQGRPLLDAGGLFTRDADRHWGSVVPKINGGLVNTLTYKDFVFNFSIDYQFGGKFFSLSESWGHYSGIFEATADVNDKGMNVRDAIADGGGVHVAGVSATDPQEVVDMYVDPQTYWRQFYNNQIAEPFIHDLSYVKLREVSIGYQIPVKRIGVDKVFKGAVFSVVSRNPWMIYRDSKNFDPSEISGVQGEDGQFPGTRSLGFNLKLNF